MAAAAASSSLYIFALLFFLLPLCSAEKSFRPRGPFLPVVKDGATLQYVTNIKQRTPLVPVKVLVHLGGSFMWVDCQSGYKSSSYRPSRCGSAQCSLAKSRMCGDCFSTPGPGCSNNTCGLFPENPGRVTTSGDLGTDVISLRSTNGSSSGRFVTVPRFLFVCGSTFLLEGLGSGVKGVAGLGRHGIALPSQLAAAFSFHREFAICLSSSTTSNGVIFFGGGPYMPLPNVDISKSFTYTPLLINRVSTAGASFSGEPSDEYFVRVKSVEVAQKQVPLNTSLLSINREGIGGTKISTVVPYTTLQTSIYEAVLQAFIREAKAMNITQVASVAPFGACFSSKNVINYRVGPGVPVIDLVLDRFRWVFFGANSMVKVNQGVLCLGFVDGGVDPTTSIVIGGHQLEDQLLEFDIAKSRLGSSGSLLDRGLKCGDFKFVSSG